MLFGFCRTWCRVPFILGMRKDLPDFPAIVWPFRSQPKVISFAHACKQRLIFWPLNIKQDASGMIVISSIKCIRIYSFKWAVVIDDDWIICGAFNQLKLDRTSRSGICWAMAPTSKSLAPFATWGRRQSFKAYPTSLLGRSACARHTKHCFDEKGRLQGSFQTIKQFKNCDHCSKTPCFDFTRFPMDYLWTDYS